MSHAALVNDVLFSFVVFLTLLLVMFIYAVIRMPPELADSPEPPMLTPPAPPALPVRPPPRPATLPGQSGKAGYTARHTTAAAPVIDPPKVSGGPPWEPAPEPPGVAWWLS
jgi:hypothetical protein